MKAMGYNTNAARESTPESRLVIGCCTFPRLPLTEESEMIEIPLTQGQFALIDDEDFELVSQFKWYAAWNPHTKSFYAQTNTKKKFGKQRTIRMHRLIMGAESGIQVDHANLNTLDNRKSTNLRFANRSENSRNRRKRVDNKTGYKGVALDKRCNKWIARIVQDGKRVEIGYYTTPEDAYAAYCEAALKFHGEFARTA